MCNNAKLWFYHGTMGSGKSLQLLATVYNFEERKIPFVIFKSNIDTRDGENVIHSRALGDKGCVDIGPEVNIFELVTLMQNDNHARLNPELKWVVIDEAQFLKETQVDQLAAIVDRYGINVICYGLRTDFKTHLFEGSKRLFEVADTITEIKSTCNCGRKTIFNARLNNGEVITDGEQIQVGGDESYLSMCRKCYYEKTKNPLYKKLKPEIL